MDHDRYGLQVMRAARYATRVYNRHLAKVSLTASQHGILEQIAQAAAISLQDLADKLIVERSSLQRTLQPLIKTELVQTMLDPLNKRRALFRLTENGKTVLESSFALIRCAEEEIETLIGKPAIQIPCHESAVVGKTCAQREHRAV